MTPSKKKKKKKKMEEKKKPEEEEQRELSPPLTITLDTTHSKDKMIN